jgi:GNAT superfamily N-acetyltransferase
MCKIIINRNKDEIIEAARIGIDAQLYIPFEYCHIFKFLKQIINNNDLKINHGALQGKIVKSLIAYENEIPAGICLLIKRKNDYIIEIFVKESFRKRGVGYALIENTKKRISKTIYVFKTSSWRSMDFLTENGIEILRG